MIKKQTKITVVVFACQSYLMISMKQISRLSLNYSLSYFKNPVERTSHPILSNLETVTTTMRSMQTVSLTISILPARAISFINVPSVTRSTVSVLEKCQVVQCRGDSIQIRIFKVLNNKDAFQLLIIYQQAKKMEIFIKEQFAHVTFPLQKKVKRH